MVVYSGQVGGTSSYHVEEQGKESGRNHSMLEFRMHSLICLKAMQVSNSVDITYPFKIVFIVAIAI